VQAGFSTGAEPSQARTGMALSGGNPAPPAFTIADLPVAAAHFRAARIDGMSPSTTPRSPITRGASQ